MYDFKLVGDNTIQGTPDPKREDDTLRWKNDLVKRPDEEPQLAAQLIQPGTEILGYDHGSDVLKPGKVERRCEPTKWDSFLIVNDSYKLLPIHQVLIRQHPGDGPGEWTDVAHLDGAKGKALRLGDGWKEIEKLDHVHERTEAVGFVVNPCDGYLINDVVVRVQEEFCGRRS